MTKVLVLSNNDNVRYLIEKLSDRCDITLCSDPVTCSYINETGPDIVVSYNYRHIVKEDVIDALGNRIINLHCSLLPWNKGSSPNLWSFIEDSPKGVTIHRLEKGLDTGGIILQKEVTFDEDIQTLAGSYDMLQKTIVDLLSDNWDIIASGDYKIKEQPSGGSYHRTSDLKALIGDRQIDYQMTISEFRNFIRSL
ncbi:MAG: formyl transferase [Lachnospiraceae bacterium]|nr:formyl transferase [Lachnospiraceae bacterium]